MSRVLLNKDGVDLLGSPIFGSDVFFFEDFMKSKVESILAMQSHLVDFGDPHVALYLLLSCLSLCKLNTTCSGQQSQRLLQRLAYVTIIHFSLNNTSWLQATLPISLGGLGLRLASLSAPHAFIGSLNSTILLVSLLLDLDTFTHFNPQKNELSLRFNLKLVSLTWTAIKPHRNTYNKPWTLTLYLTVGSLPL